MISSSNVIKMKIVLSGKAELENLHMYLCHSAIDGDKEFAVCSSNLTKLMYKSVVSNTSEVISVSGRNDLPDSPFDQDTYIVLTENYKVKNVRIDRSLLTYPTTLPSKKFDEFNLKFKPKRSYELDIKMICKKNLQITTPYSKYPF